MTNKRTSRLWVASSKLDPGTAVMQHLLHYIHDEYKMANLNVKKPTMLTSRKRDDEKEGTKATSEKLSMYIISFVPSATKMPRTKAREEKMITCSQEKCSQMVCGT